MEILTLGLLIVLLVAILAIAFRVFSKSGHPVTEEILKACLDEFERRLKDESERLRSGLNSMIQSAAQSSTKSQQDLALQLTAAVEQTRSNAQTVIADSFLALQRTMASSLTESRRAQDERLDRIDTALQNFATSLTQTCTDLRTTQLEISNTQSKVLIDGANEFRDKISGNLGELTKQLMDGQAAVRMELATTLQAQREAQVTIFQELQERVTGGLELVRKDNTGNLEKIRSTVEEKLTSTLESRLGESFRTVSEQLENVYKGLGEMQNLASGVGDLKRVLTNVRSRGSFGEVILGTLLQQVLVPDQYDCNVATIPNSSEYVEYAIKLPGRDEEIKHIYLPIDAKFPREDFERLQQAYDSADVSAIDDARKSLRRRVLDEAKTICRKYIGPPHTTDFALLFLPTEGLYVEVLNIPGLCDALQNQHRVIPVGPTTLHAVLNSLQLGF